MAEMSRQFRNELRRLVREAFPDATEEEIDGKTDHLMIRAVEIGKKLRINRQEKEKK